MLFLLPQNNSKINDSVLTWARIFILENTNSQPQSEHTHERTCESFCFCFDIYLIVISFGNNRHSMVTSTTSSAHTSCGIAKESHFLTFTYQSTRIYRLRLFQRVWKCLDEWATIRISHSTLLSGTRQLKCKHSNTSKWSIPNGKQVFTWRWASIILFRFIGPLFIDEK